MGGQTVVLNSGDLDAIVADARGLPPPELPKDSGPKEAAKEEKTEGVAKPKGNGNGHEPDPIADGLAEFASKHGLNADQQTALSEMFRKNVGRLTAKRREAEEFGANAYNRERVANEELAKKDREISRLKAQMQPAPNQAQEEAPKRENFATAQEYEDARVDWRVKEGMQKERKADLERQEQERLQQVMANARQRIEKAKEVMPDIYESLQLLQAIPLPVYLDTYLGESEMLPELAHYFAKEPDKLNEITRMRPDKAMVAIGKIESKLQPFSTSKAESQHANDTLKPKSSPATAAEPNPKPRATAPIKPLNGSGGVEIDKPERDMTYAEAKVDFEKRTGRNLGRRQRH